MAPMRSAVERRHTLLRSSVGAPLFLLFSITGVSCCWAIYQIPLVLNINQSNSKKLEYTPKNQIKSKYRPYVPSLSPESCGHGTAWQKRKG